MRRLLHGFASDWRQTRRALGRSPRHAATVVLCLAAGIAVNVTVLSLINALFYGGLPGVRNRTDLVRVLIGATPTAAADGGGAADGHLDDLSLNDFRSLTASTPSMLRGFAA